MSEADKIIKSLRDSGKKVEEFYMNNKTSDNNVANIEENIKTIKNLLQMLENGFLTEEMCPIPSWDPTPKYAAALKYILAELEQKDKRIQELEEKLLDMIQGTEIINKETPEYVKENYIPKQAVMDELNRHKFAYEEFNKMYDNTHYEDDEKRASDFYMIVTEDRIVQVLQELLETK